MTKEEMIKDIMDSFEDENPYTYEKIDEVLTGLAKNDNWDDLITMLDIRRNESEDYNTLLIEELMTLCENDLGTTFTYEEACIKYFLDNNGALNEINVNNKEKIVNVIIPNIVKKLGVNAFCNCVNLQEIKFEDNSQLQTIHSHAFYGCSSLKNIEIPDSVYLIGAKSFAHCSSLKEIHMPKSLHFLQDGAFIRCSNLESITLPRSLTRIGPRLFREQ